MSQHQINGFRRNKHTMNRSDKHVLLKWKYRHSLLTRIRTREPEKGIRSLCSRTRWAPQIQIPTRSVHQTFRASSHESSTRCAFHISILPTRSHTCLDIRTVQIDRGDGELQSLWPASSDLSRLIFCHCFAVTACGIGLFHMARASSRLTSVQVNAMGFFWA